VATVNDNWTVVTDTYTILFISDTHEGTYIQWNFPKSNLKGPEKKFELRKFRITENTQKIQEKSVFVNFKVR
jgi:hypothetical protein